MSDLDEDYTQDMDTITGAVYDKDARLVRVTFEVHPGTKPFMDPKHGQWIPGDPPEFKIRFAEREREDGRWDDVTETVEQLIDINKALEMAD